MFIASLPASDAGDGRHTLHEGEYVLRLNGLDVYSPSEPPVRDGVPLSLQESGVRVSAAVASKLAHAKPNARGHTEAERSLLAAQAFVKRLPALSFVPNVANRVVAPRRGKGRAGCR